MPGRVGSAGGGVVGFHVDNGGVVQVVIVMVAARRVSVRVAIRLQPGWLAGGCRDQGAVLAQCMGMMVSVEKLRNHIDKPRGQRACGRRLSRANRTMKVRGFGQLLGKKQHTLELRCDRHEQERP